MGREEKSNRSGWVFEKKNGSQLRDRKINARTHYRSSDYQILLSRASLSSPAAVSPSRSVNAAGSTPQPDAAVVDGESPCFSSRFYGNGC
ncbi:hypothetical protein Hanom_Chr10g00967211 [Helianthus anomalus]